MDPEKKPETIVATADGLPPPRLDCIKCFDALWFCYSPFHQMQSYYRYGEFDNCFGKWGDLVDCLSLKTKRKAEVEEILVAREKARPHIWTYRTVDEASEHWWRMYKHVVMMSPRTSPPNPAGASEENIRILFKKAYRTAPQIVFIDEIDTIASKRENLQTRNGTAYSYTVNDMHG